MLRYLRNPSSIRLIEFLPDSASERITCKIHQFDMAITQDLNYYAVSYYWGNREPTRDVNLVDQSGHTYLRRLHENLWQFLNHMSQQKMFRRFYWTDCLCLDQKNDMEMEQQIPRMGNIYSAAEEVVVWLGHEQRGEAAMELVRDWPGPVNWLHVDVNNKEELERANLVQSMRSEVAEAAVYLLLLPYWSRVWIVQEVVLARKVRVTCGNISLDLDDFRSKVDPFRHETTELNYQPTVWSLCELRKKGGKKPLWEVTRDFDLCMSTRTIDKVYGFLGLVADHDDGTCPAKLIDVNINKKPFEVSWDTAFECRAPWDQYPSVLLSLGQMLWEPGEKRVSWDFCLLEEYAQGIRTSEEHARFANIALCVFDAVNIFIMHIAFDFIEWAEVVRSILLSATRIPCKSTGYQNVAAVGLALTARRREIHSMWKNHRKLGTPDEISASSQWRCSVHQTEQHGRGLTVKDDLQGCPKARISYEQNVLKRACGKFSPSCDGSMMTLKIQDIGFGLVILSDVGDEVAEGTIFLDIGVNCCVCPAAEEK